jgi:hypothetical protein
MADSSCAFCSNQRPALLAGGCPHWLAELVLARQDLQNVQQNQWDVLEFFSGHGNLHRACQAAGLHAVGFDHLRGPQEDLHHFCGLEAAIDRILEVKRHGLVWFAPPCSWWTFLASPNHKRSFENRYEGDSSNMDVRLANSLAHVVAALVRLCASLGLAVVMEQPSDSCLFSYGCIKKSLAMIQAATVTTYLSAFSDEIPIPKPLILKGTCKWLGSLFRNKPNRSFEQGRAYTKRPDGKVCGQAELQATQQYPWAFGEAVWRSKMHLFNLCFYHFVCLFVFLFLNKQASR